MAAGDVYVFNEFALDCGKAVHDLTADTLRLGIVDNTITPAVDDTSPTWGDYSANEVSGTNYTAGGMTLSGVTWTLVGGVPTLDFTNVTISYSASGFNDGYWGILYNDDAASDQAILAVDLGGPVGNDVEDLLINVHATAMLQMPRAASVS